MNQIKTFLKSIFFILLLAISNLSVCQDSLKIMTYNIEGMKPGTFPGIRLGFIIDKIQELDPDIIGLQELNEPLDGNGEHNQCKEIARYLSEHFEVQYTCYQQFTHLSWDNQFREFIGIITKHPVVDSGYYQLATGVFPRKVVWNYIDTPMGMVNFFNTHLSFNSHSVRLVQAGQILDYVNDILPDKIATATFLTGDFNDVPNTPTIDLITDSNADTTFIDSYAITNPDHNGYTVPSIAPDKRIDYIFISNISQLEADTSFVVSDTAIFDDIYSSDHLAVLSVFKEQMNSTGQEIRLHSPFELHQNTPNPFTRYSSIQYELFESAHVKLSVFNHLGIEVMVLTDSFQQAGKYTVRVDASKLPGCIYFYTIKSDRFIQTKKMIIAR